MDKCNNLLNRRLLENSKNEAVFVSNAKERKCLPKFLILRIFLLGAFEIFIMYVGLSFASCACVDSILFSTLRIENQDFQSLKNKIKNDILKYTF